MKSVGGIHNSNEPELNGIPNKAPQISTKKGREVLPTQWLLVFLLKPLSNLWSYYSHGHFTASSNVWMAYICIRMCNQPYGIAFIPVYNISYYCVIHVHK